MTKENRDSLTTREMEALLSLVGGPKPEVKASTLNCHLGSVNRKLQAHSRTEAVLKAMKLGLIPAVKPDLPKQQPSDARRVASITCRFIIDEQHRFAKEHRRFPSILVLSVDAHRALVDLADIDGQYRGMKIEIDYDLDGLSYVLR